MYQVVGWDTWQSYRKDRGQPPWIKVHRRLLRNDKWIDLNDSERGQLIAMWLLAADKDGVITASPDKIKKICFMSSTPNINKFIELGLLQPCGATVASNGSHGGVLGQSSSEVGQNRSDKITVPRPDGVTDQTWKDFLTLRKGKKAVFTQTALDRMMVQVRKSGKTLEEVLQLCCARGWQGFDASWVEQEDDYYNPDLSEVYHDPS